MKKEHQMTPPEKPEWIAIAESDQSATPRKISKGLPVIALLAATAIIGIGAVVAQTQEESPANAVESTSLSLQSSQSPTTSDLVPDKNHAAPAIGTMPTDSREGFEGEGDDDEGDDD